MRKHNRPKDDTLACGCLLFMAIVGVAVAIKLVGYALLAFLVVKVAQFAGLQ